MAEPTCWEPGPASPASCARALALDRLRDPARKEQRVPVQLRISVVDVGNFATSTGASFPRDALVGYLHVEAAKPRVTGRRRPTCG
ncbi:MAG TPA: hypothetical protein VIL20_25485 [Sandaracinaceae bacterium]